MDFYGKLAVTVRPMDPMGLAFQVSYTNFWKFEAAPSMANRQVLPSHTSPTSKSSDPMP